MKKQGCWWGKEKVNKVAFRAHLERQKAQWFRGWALESDCPFISSGSTIIGYIILGSKKKKYQLHFVLPSCYYEAARRPSPDTNIMLLDFPFSRTIDKLTSLLYKLPNLWYSIIAADKRLRQKIRDDNIAHKTVLSVK